MSPKEARARAFSEIQGVILMLALTVLLAALVLSQLLSFPAQFHLEFIPPIFVITSVEDVDEISGELNHDSRVVLLHTGTGDYRNRDLRAVFYRNDVALDCRIATLNGHDFISTTHTGVQWMGGSGCSGDLWSPKERIVIDLADGTFRPGDNVRVDIINRITGTPLSRHRFSCN